MAARIFPRRWQDEARFCATRPAVRLAALAAGAGAVLLAVVVGAQWLPAYRAHGARVAEAAALRAEIRSVLLARQVRDAYRTGLAQVDAWEQRLQGGASRGAVVAAVSVLAQRSGLAVLSQALRDGEHPTGVRTLQQELVLEGPYGGLKAFLAGLGALPSWTEVRTAQVEPAGGDATRLHAVLRLVTYREAKAEAP